jgi:uncharacterized BrkB/YihY/UPF0761 family membrane protein
MIWFQWTSFAMLVGAEVNAELVKARKARNRELDLQTEKVRTQERLDKAA